VLLLQTLIVLTGNYNFFNLLTMFLCVLLFDDAALRRLVPRWLESKTKDRGALPSRAATVAAAALALVVVPVGLNRIWETLAHKDLPVLGALTRAVSPLFIVNPYGLFAVMTTSRPEILIEGSADGKIWREYVFRYKPGPLSRPAMWNIPHQPRLDWQMWFAALGSVRENPWIVGLMWRLLEASPPVLELLDSNPFANGPPKYVRAQLYEYRFADQATHAATGQWWVRRLEGVYFPEVSLADFKRAADRGASYGPAGRANSANVPPDAAIRSIVRCSAQSDRSTRATPAMGPSARVPSEVILDRSDRQAP
jgi:hypothetical protein